MLKIKSTSAQLVYMCRLFITLMALHIFSRLKMVVMLCCFNQLKFTVPHLSLVVWWLDGWRRWLKSREQHSIHFSHSPKPNYNEYTRRYLEVILMWGSVILIQREICWIQNLSERSILVYISIFKCTSITEVWADAIRNARCDPMWNIKS